MNKDWTGNSNAIWKTLGATNHTDKERADLDYYATDGKAAELLLQVENFSNNIWECAVGGGDLAQVFIDNGYNVKCSDIIDRGFQNTEIIDFLEYNEQVDYDIITNPPYSKAQEFIEHGLQLLKPNHKIAMFLKLQFLEGKKRRKLFDTHPPTTVYVSSSRILCAKNGDFEGMKAGGGSAVAYAWYIWTYEKPERTEVKWIN